MQAITVEAGSGISIVPVRAEHAAPLASLVQRNLAHLGAYLPFLTSLSSVDAARSHLQAAVVQGDRGNTGEWHVFVDETLCGAIRVKNIDMDDRRAEIGYFIGSDFAGRGIVSLAVRAVLAHCFESLQLNRIELRCASTNARSIRMAERLGFVREGLLRQHECLHGAFVDQLVYGLLRSEFVR